MRILDRSAVELSLSGIELPFALRENTVSRLHLDDPYGAILVTGPTGYRQNNNPVCDAQ